LEKRLIRASELIDSIIADKITHNTAFDPQCETPRAKYLYELVSLYERKEYIYPEVIKAFENIHWCDIRYYDNSDDAQVIDFVTCMVKNCLYERKTYLDKMSASITEATGDFGQGIYGIIELFGMEGVAHIAELLGGFILDGKGQELDKIPFFSNLSDTVGKTAEEIRDCLRVEHNEKIDAYLNYADGHKVQSNYKRPTFDEMVERFNNGKSYPSSFYGLVKNASADEIEKLKQLFINTENDELKRGVLRGLCGIKADMDEAYLWKELERTENMDYKSAIIKALIPFGNEKLRSLLDEYPQDGVKTAAFEAFVSRCEEPDKKRMESELLEMNVFEIHHLRTDMIGYEQLQKMSFYPAVLRILYERNECKYCQERIIQKMSDAGCIDENLAAELRYDADEEIRKLAQS
jgi:hypothetical protein